MTVPARFWGIGIAAALATHAAILALIFWQPPESGARGPGLGGIEVSLGAAGAPQGNAPEAAAMADARAVDPDEAVADSTPRDTVAARPVEDAATAEPETVASRQVAPEAAAPELPDAVQSPATEAATIRQAVDSRRVEAEVDAAEQPQPAEPVPTEAPATEQPETVAARPEVQPEQDDAAEAGSAGAPSSPAGAGRASGAGTGSGEDAAAGGSPGASADYMAQLRAWLERHKQYPRRAQRRRQEGTALLQFVIDREGRVLEYKIRESSGHEILDEEVAAMIERAQPLPGFPDDMPRTRLELVVPIQFLLM